MMHGVETMVRTEVETMLLHGLPQAELEVGAWARAGCGGQGLGAGCMWRCGRRRQRRVKGVRRQGRGSAASRRQPAVPWVRESMCRARDR